MLAIPVIRVPDAIEFSELMRDIVRRRKRSHVHAHGSWDEDCLQAD